MPTWQNPTWQKPTWKKPTYKSSNGQKPTCYRKLRMVDKQHLFDIFFSHFRKFYMQDKDSIWMWHNIFCFCDAQGLRSLDRVKKCTSYDHFCSNLSWTVVEPSLNTSIFYIVVTCYLHMNVLKSVVEELKYKSYYTRPKNIEHRDTDLRDFPLKTFISKTVPYFFNGHGFRFLMQLAALYQN